MEAGVQESIASVLQAMPLPDTFRPLLPIYAWSPGTDQSWKQSRRISSRSQDAQSTFAELPQTSRSILVRSDSIASTSRLNFAYCFRSFSIRPRVISNWSQARLIASMSGCNDSPDDKVYHRRRNTSEHFRKDVCFTWNFASMVRRRETIRRYAGRSSCLIFCNRLSSINFSWPAW